MNSAVKKQYKITHTEHLIDYFYVEAENEQDAINVFNRMVDNGEIDFSHVEMIESSDVATLCDKSMNYITIDGKEYRITREAAWEYRSSRVNPESWVALYLAEPDDDDAIHIAWYYVDPDSLDNTELEDIDYEHPHDIE